MATKSDRGVSEFAQNAMSFIVWGSVFAFLGGMLWFFSCTETGRKLDKMETEKYERAGGVLP